MSGVPKANTAALAASVVGMADEIMKGVHDHRDDLDDEARAHYVKAAITEAIAIGAFVMLKKIEHLEDIKRCDGHHPQHQTHHPNHHQGEHRPEGNGHIKDMVMEALGMYSMVRQLPGHNEHHILKLVAEGLGAAALAKEVDRDLAE